MKKLVIFSALILVCGCAGVRRERIPAPVRKTISFVKSIKYLRVDPSVPALEVSYTDREDPIPDSEKWNAHEILKGSWDLLAGEGSAHFEGEKLKADLNCRTERCSRATLKIGPKANSEIYHPSEIDVIHATQTRENELLDPKTEGAPLAWGTPVGPGTIREDFYFLHSLEFKRTFFTILTAFKPTREDNSEGETRRTAYFGTTGFRNAYDDLDGTVEDSDVTLGVVSDEPVMIGYFAHPEIYRGEEVRILVPGTRSEVTIPNPNYQ